MSEDFFSGERHLSTDSTILWWGIHENGWPAFRYFTMADLYSPYFVHLYKDDFAALYKFFVDYDDEPVTITQPYTTKINGHEAYCVLKLERVENVEGAPRPVRRLTFYAECWGDTLEESLEEEKVRSWSSWDDYFNWDSFENLRLYIKTMTNMINLEASE